MSYRSISIVILVIFLLESFTNPPAEKSKWKSLFNGKTLAGWDTYLGPKYDTITKKRETIPVGLNNDPSKVFSVVELDGEKVLRISGENFGGISTKSEYENYHLQLQFRWGELKWYPRKTAKRDSGVMYHSVGPNGADGGNWMRSHEFQVQEGDCGDYWGCAGAVFDVRAQKNKDNLFIYSKEGNILTFSTGSPTGRRCIKFPDAEKPTGDWNTIDLYCFGNTSVHMINGVVCMVLHNSRQIEGGLEIPLTKGKIQIQSEGSEIFYRNIKITEIKKLPDNISKE